MAFSEETKQAAFQRAGGKCECRRLSCRVHSTVYCGVILARGQWHAHHKTAVAAGGQDTLSNCEILCIPCHKSTQTYGA
jgi:5-methylcytosine-specific restriction endonuclease McrA